MIIKRIGNQDVILTEPEKDILLAGYIAMEKSLKESAELVIEQEENDDNQTEEDL
jgi:hypothetical protein